MEAMVSGSSMRLFQALQQVPICPVANKDRMGAGRDGFPDLLQMFVHGVRVGIGHDKPRAHGAIGTDRSE